MSEMDEKLNTLLSDPGSMARIMQLAQQLSGTMGGAEKSTPEPPPPPPADPADQTGGGTAGFGGLGGLDPALLGKLLPLAQEYGRSNSASMQLLNALRPFLKPEKQGKGGTGGTSGKAHPSGEKNSCRNGRDSVYNRYIRNEQGAYSRIPQQEPAPGPVSGRPPPPAVGAPAAGRRLVTGQSSAGRAAAQAAGAISPSAGGTVSGPAAVPAPSGGHRLRGSAASADPLFPVPGGGR